MKIKDCMSKNWNIVGPETSIAELAKMMRDQDFGFMPVAENDRMIGVVTDRDIVLRCVARGADPIATNVRNVMTARTYYCFDDQTIDEVLDNMSEIQVRRLPVVNRQKRLVGIVSLGDLAQMANRLRVGQVEQAITAREARKAA
jgi:CBS domain-containing protein